MAELTFTDPAERENLGAFVARAVRLDQQAVVRLRARGDGAVEAWVSTPFDVLATRSARAELTPTDVTVAAPDLLAGLAVARDDSIDPGHPRDMQWRSPLPPAKHWQVVDHVPAKTIAELADKGLAVARENVGPQGTPPASLLDQTVLTVEGDGLAVKVPLRCLFALSGMGFLAEPDDTHIRITATDAWMRLDARYGAVVRRRHALLPLLV
ncbi:hypothetical protein ACFPM7_10180 [Actinokineospora guangxiensis]|uniref:Uncharacterized protein n=1 Tax=Actinokineospora guangxiensis TaxID=1490288 RepID=A0ABW0EM19_9PSEU